jgi:hypothetical protein
MPRVVTLRDGHVESDLTRDRVVPMQGEPLSTAR